MVAKYWFSMNSIVLTRYNTCSLKISVHMASNNTDTCYIISLLTSTINHHDLQKVAFFTMEIKCIIHFMSWYTTRSLTLTRTQNGNTCTFIYIQSTGLAFSPLRVLATELIFLSLSLSLSLIFFFHVEVKSFPLRETIWVPSKNAVSANIKHNKILPLNV